MQVVTTVIEIRFNNADGDGSLVAQKTKQTVKAVDGFPTIFLFAQKGVAEDKQTSIGEKVPAVQQCLVQGPQDVPESLVDDDDIVTVRQDKAGRGTVIASG